MAIFFYNEFMIEEKIGRILRAKGKKLSTAESCTGGLVSSRLTDVAGSSDYITLNFVTYAYEAKEHILGVKHETLMKFGAVSEECVIEMARGTLKATGSDVVLCTSGVAGPGGGTTPAEKREKTEKGERNHAAELRNVSCFCG